MYPRSTICFGQGTAFFFGKREDNVEFIQQAWILDGQQGDDGFQQLIVSRDPSARFFIHGLPPDDRWNM
jgi:hypothetical protein